MRILGIKIENFGKLHNVSLDFSKGINVICGDNETGKSTIGAFIKYMLYGFSAKGKDASTSEKIKYFPWDNSEPCGSMTVSTSDGRVYNLFRKGTSKSGVTVTDVNGDKIGISTTPGEFFLGLDDSTFEKTAFAGQNGISETGLGGLSHVVERLLFCDSDTDVQAVRKRLVAERNLVYNGMRRTGSILDLEKRINELEGTLAESESVHKELFNTETLISDVRREYEHYKQIISDCNDRLEAISAVEAKHSLAHYHELADRLSAVKEKHRILLEQASFDGFIPDKSYLFETDSAYHSFLADARKLSDAKKHLADASREESDYRRNNTLYEIVSDIFARNGEIEVDKAAAGIAGRIRTLSHRIKLCKRLMIVFACLIVTLPVCIVLGIVKKKAVTELNKLCDEYGCENPDELAKFMVSYVAFKSLDESLSKRLSRAQSEYDAALENAKKGFKELESLVGKSGYKLNGNYTGEEQLSQDYCRFRDKISALIERIDACERELNAAKLEHDAFIKANDIENLEAEADKVCDSSICMDFDAVNRMLSDATTRSNELSAEIPLLERKAGLLIGSVADVGEVCSLLEQAKAELRSETQKKLAFELALEALDKACESMSRNSLPCMSERAGELFSLMTDNKYNRLCVHENGEKVTFGGDSEQMMIDAGYLSSGAFDAAGIALRLSFGECFCSEKPALVFDDSFSRVDDKRLGNIMNILTNLSEDYQIFILTCHNREEKFLSKGDKIIKMVH